MHDWNAKLYDTRHSFVNEMVNDLLQLLAPQPGERILDVGCGTGPLTKKIADSSATVVGIDASPAMIVEASTRFPELSFHVLDATHMKFDSPFDAVFSNAVLHWVRPPEKAAQCMFDALRPGGRLVLEMGGHGNVAKALATAAAAANDLKIDLKGTLDINYFPSIARYTAVLEAAGFDVTFAVLFDRPTPLEDGRRGLSQWLRMFRPAAIAKIPDTQIDQFEASLQQHAAPGMFDYGQWTVDYRRLRVVARRPV